MWYVYILRCSDDTLYTGITNHPAQRLRMHNAGKGAKYTRARLPVEFVCLIPAESHSQALRLECEIKQYSRQQKLQFIDENYEKTCISFRSIVT